MTNRFLLITVNFYWNILETKRNHWRKRRKSHRSSTRVCVGRHLSRLTGRDPFQRPVSSERIQLSRYSSGVLDCKSSWKHYSWPSVLEWHKNSRKSRNVHVGNRILHLSKIFSFNEFEFWFTILFGICAGT